MSYELTEYLSAYESFHEAVDKELDYIIEKGGLDILVKAHVEGFKFDREIYHFAIDYSQLEIFKWAYHIGVKLDSEIISFAISYENLEILEFLRDENCLGSEVILYAAKYGNLDVFKWAYRNGVKLDNEIISYTVGCGNLEILEFLHHKNCLGYDVILNAAKYGNLDALKWALDHRYTKNSEATSVAAKNGHLHILEYLLDYLGRFKTLNGNRRYPFYNRWICYNAALGGHLKILKWARDRNFHWDTDVTYVAASKRNAEMLKWLLINGCPWDDKIVKFANDNGWKDIQEIIEKYAPKNTENTFSNALKRNPFNLLGWVLTYGKFSQS